MNLLNYLSISHVSSGPLSKTQKLRLGFTTFVGAGLCVLVIGGLVNALAEKFHIYAQGPWILPTVTICFAAVLVCTQVGGVRDKKGAEEKEE